MLFAQPLDRAASVGTRGVEIVDAEIEGALEQRLGGVFALDGAEARPGAEADARDHLAGFAQTAFRERSCSGPQRFVGGAERDCGSGGFEKLATRPVSLHVGSFTVDGSASDGDRKSTRLNS